MVEWLEDVYAHVAKGQDEEAGDLLYTELFDRLEDPAAIDTILENVDFERLNTLLTVAVLSATLPVRGLLKSRPGAVKRARLRLMQLAPERVEPLLAGL